MCTLYFYVITHKLKNNLGETWKNLVLTFDKNLKMSQSSVFTFALLHSNSSLKDGDTQNLLNSVKKIIQNDDILSGSLHLVCIDNNYARDIMSHNTSGVSVHYWPIFAIRQPNKGPEIYPLSSANEVFSQVYQAYNKLLKDQGRPLTTKKPPRLEDLSENNSVKILTYCPSDKSELGPVNMVNNYMVSWNHEKHEKHKTPKNIYICTGDSISFTLPLNSLIH